MKIRSIKKQPLRLYLPQPVVSSMQPVGIGVVGCGFVFDCYMQTHHLHPWLNILGVFDKDETRLQQVKEYYDVKIVDSLDAILSCPEISIVLNFTNPSEHFEVSKTLIEAGKNVYSEKPLATSLELATELESLAEKKGVQIGCAPCTIFGETAQTMWHALRDGLIGEPRLIIANLDEGASHFGKPGENLISPSGAKWPAWDEYRVGCTVEHAGYVITWLVAFFGSVKRVLSYSRLCFPDKGIDCPAEELGPDFSTATLEFENSIVAQFTNSIVAPPNHAIAIVGEKGTLRSNHVWPNASPVQIADHEKPWLYSNLPFIRPPVWDPKCLSKPWYYRNYYTRRFVMDPKDLNFGVGDDKFRGVTEFMLAIAGKKPFLLGGDFSTHITEVTYAIQDRSRNGQWQTMSTTAPTVEPMSRACEKT